uniref:Protein Wnt n=1 Tax=Eptatretus burgeri TaxID=7764 RepID=A0A8C4WRH3_EPTBU
MPHTPYLLLYPLLLTALPSLCSQPGAAQVNTWWSLGLLGVQKPQMYLPGGAPACRHLTSLSRGQHKLCHLYPHHMPFMAEGARLGLRECQYQMQGYRWNCSLNGGIAALRRTTMIGSRETALAYSLTAAGAVHVVSRACGQGALTMCGCGSTPRPHHLQRDWLWGGCGDNIEHGVRFAGEFADASERERSPQPGTDGFALKIVKLHNNKAGRRAVLDLASIACKCHGVSGSCSVRTCWPQLAPFRSVSHRLHSKYISAVAVRLNRRSRLRQVKRRRRHGHPATADLVFLDPSPDYCAHNDTTGSLGTVGRTCKLISRGADSCELLCCGRSYERFQSTVVKRCHCKFQWCCFVRCKTCTSIVDAFICN